VSDRPDYARVVAPRKLAGTYLPIIAVSQEEEQVLLESGEVHPLESLPAILSASPPSMVVTMNAARLLYCLDRVFTDHPLWQFRVSPDTREIRRVNGKPGSRVAGTVVHFFGFKSPQKRKPGRYHYPVDPTIFCHKSIGEIRPGDTPRVQRLMEWGMDVRAWCRDQRLRITPTGGGVAGQLLRDARWFPEERRKVPRATNDRARVRLPGNYYRLMVGEDTRHHAVYLDMKSAHHNVASQLSFPDPNTLMARGRFHVSGVSDVTVPDTSPWVKRGTRAFDRVMNMHGLLYVNLGVPHIPRTMFAPPYMEKPGEHMAWVFTNELPTIQALGGTVNWIAAAWASPGTDTGLNQYARWAMRELDAQEAERKAWLKPTLLATYGFLAARPSRMEFGFKQAQSGEPRQYPAGPGMLQATALVGKTEREIPTANVIYRGMIEAQQRVEVLTLARTLETMGHHVLAVYADSVFIEAGGQLPMLPHPWQVECELTDLHFFSSTSFTSRQLTKLPGIPRDGRHRLRHIEGRRTREDQWREAGAKIRKWRGEDGIPF
jgi:hypothetical protein